MHIEGQRDTLTWADDGELRVLSTGSVDLPGSLSVVFSVRCPTRVKLGICLEALIPVFVICKHPCFLSITLKSYVLLPACSE